MRSAREAGESLRLHEAERRASDSITDLTAFVVKEGLTGQERNAHHRSCTAVTTSSSPLRL